MLTARGKDSILVADAATGKDLLRLDGVRSRALSLAPHGNLMAWSRQGEILMRSTGVDGTEIRVSTALAKVLAYSPDGTILASLDGESIVRFWDVGARKELASVRLSRAEDRLAFSPDGARLAVATERSIAIVPVPAR